LSCEIRWTRPARSAGTSARGVVMSRFIAFAALAALIAGCSDATVAPRSLSLHQTGPSFDAGTPPPPPVTGDGSGSFSTLSSDAPLAASVDCSVFTKTQYQFVYSTDAADGMNQIAHIKFDGDLSHQITIHQRPNEPVEVDAEGIIAGTD